MSYVFLSQNNLFKLIVTEALLRRRSSGHRNPRGLLVLSTNKGMILRLHFYTPNLNYHFHTSICLFTVTLSGAACDGCPLWKPG